MADKHRAGKSQNGAALLIALLALAVVSVVAFHIALIATAEVHISDNYESLIEARAAATAGLHHGRALLRGLRFDDVLEGPDGTHDADPGYLARARTHSYRLPIPWVTARMLDIVDPAGMLAGLPDDGVINTGRHPGGNGLALIPVTGIAQTAPAPQHPGMPVVSRYFVKVSDNNGEAAELAGDPEDNPFRDGDGQVILRSMGIARTIAQATRAGLRHNSTVALEARFKRLSTYDLDAPLVIQSDAVAPESAEMFAGSLFLVQGGGANPGIAVIDTKPGDGIAPALQVTSRLAAEQAARIRGAGLQPSVKDGTAEVASHAEKRLLLNQSFACDSLKSLPLFADSAFAGNQNWPGAPPPSLGHYDAGLPPTAPGQEPKATFVAGDLQIAGDVEGGGLLVVTGRVTITGRFSFSGLILILGAGELDLGGSGTITGGIYVAKISCASMAWGSVRLTIRDHVQVLFNQEAIRMALTLFPPRQLSFREITAIIDPNGP
jgi:hypothetical protein